MGFMRAVSTALLYATLALVSHGCITSTVKMTPASPIFLADTQHEAASLAHPLRQAQGKSPSGSHVASLRPTDDLEQSVVQESPPAQQFPWWNGEYSSSFRREWIVTVDGCERYRPPPKDDALEPKLKFRIHGSERTMERATRNVQLYRDPFDWVAVTERDDSLLFEKPSNKFMRAFGDGILGYLSEYPVIGPTISKYVVPFAETYNTLTHDLVVSVRGDVKDALKDMLGGDRVQIRAQSDPSSAVFERDTVLVKPTKPEMRGRIDADIDFSQVRTGFLGRIGGKVQGAVPLYGFVLSADVGASYDFGKETARDAAFGYDVYVGFAKRF